VKGSFEMGDVICISIILAVAAVWLVAVGHWTYVYCTAKPRKSSHA